MSFYCLKCRKPTPTFALQRVVEGSGAKARAVEKGTCAVCGARKRRYAARVGGDIQSALGKLPGLPWSRYSGEKHIPGYNYCGPGTRLDRRLGPDNVPRPGEEPVNRVDSACLRHDLAYSRNDGQTPEALRQRHLADVDLIHAIDAIADKTVKERLGGAAAKAGLKAKLLFGGACSASRPGAAVAVQSKDQTCRYLQRAEGALGAPCRRRR